METLEQVMTELGSGRPALTDAERNAITCVLMDYVRDVVGFDVDPFGDDDNPPQELSWGDAYKYVRATYPGNLDLKNIRNLAMRHADTASLCVGAIRKLGL